jgi:hypothetical protein
VPPDATTHAILTLYCRDPDCAAFSGTPVDYEDGPGYRHFATLACPHCGGPLFGKRADDRVTLTLDDALRAYAALLVWAERAERAADAALTPEYRQRHERLRAAYLDASHRVHAACLVTHARLKKLAMEESP